LFKYFAVFILSIALFLWWLPEYDPNEKVRRLSEQSEIFFNPKQRLYSFENDVVTVKLRKAKTV
jgi:hypothetical protein